MHGFAPALTRGSFCPVCLAAARLVKKLIVNWQSAVRPPDELGLGSIVITQAETSERASMETTAPPPKRAPRNQFSPITPLQGPTVSHLQFPHLATQTNTSGTTTMLTDADTPSSYLADRSIVSKVTSSSAASPSPTSIRDLTTTQLDILTMPTTPYSESVIRRTQ